MAIAIQLAGLVLALFGAVRIVRAPSLAGRRAAPGVGDSARYARGLTDFYRISGALAVLGGVLLVLVPIFAR